MAKTINETLRDLKDMVDYLQAQISVLTQEVQGKNTQPYSQVGSLIDGASSRTVDPIVGMGQTGGFLPFNDAELKTPPLGSKPDDPRTGYNKHSHSRYAGGALDVNTLELVEYEYNPAVHNKHCQQFFPFVPPIKTVQNKNGEEVDKIGHLDITFDPETQTYKAGLANEIDVENTNLVKRDSENNIQLDENGVQMSSPLYNSDPAKTNLIWDKQNKIWRVLSVYADD